MMRAVFLAVFVLLPALALATDTHAVDATLDQARVEFKAKHPAKALALLDHALGQSTALLGYQARIQYFRARCLTDLHRPNEARLALERFITQSRTAEDKRRGREQLAKLQRRFYGAVRVECTGGNRRVILVDAPGKPRHCPAQWDGLLPGKYQLKITGGKAPKTLSVELRAGEVLTHNLDSQRQRRARKVAPSEVVYAWGGAVNLGVAQARGEVPQAVSMSPGVLASVGIFGQALWPVSGLKLGPRLELRYRHWRMDREANDTVLSTQTHGIRVPLLAHLQLPRGLSLGLGPAVEMVLSANEGSQGLATSSVAVAALAELGWRLPWIPALTVGLRYELTAVDVFDEVDLRRDGATLGLSWAL